MMPNSDAAAMGNNDALVGNGSGSVGFTSVALKKGPWTAAEDAILMEYVKKHGEGNWNAVQKNAGLSRCGKSCRLRWANHLRPNLRKGSFSSDEERLILELHSKLGNKWARMAAQLPGRTDNEIKNYWNTRVKRHQRAGLPLYPQDIKKQAVAFNVNENNQTFPSPSQPLQQQQQQQQQQPKSNFGSPLSMFDPVNFPVTSPFLTAPLYSRFKRFRDNNNNSSSHGFSLPFSATPAPPPPLFPQFQFAPLHGNFDFNPLPPPMLGTPFEINTGSPFSMKMELPSNQLPQPADTATAASGTTANSGLLDALLGESQAIVGSDNSRRDGFFDEKYGLDGLVNANDASQRDDSSSAHSSPGLKRKKEGTDEINSAVDEDLNSLLDIMYSNSGEISNGQSSGVTDDEIGLEMQQLASSMSAPNTTNPDWTSWNKLPGIC